jgi:hypothetical protein
MCGTRVSFLQLSVTVVVTSTNIYMYLPHVFEDSDEAVEVEGSLPVTEQSDLSDWIKSTLGQKVNTAPYVLQDLLLKGHGNELYMRSSEKVFESVIQWFGRSLQ